jgi:hypothetical protein
MDPDPDSDLDPDADPSIFIINLQDANILLLYGTFTSFFQDKK